MKKALALLVSLGAFALAQVTSTLDGTVTDPQGAIVVGAQIVVNNVDNNQTMHATSDDQGHWIISAVPVGTYRVTVTMAGFRKLTMPGVSVNAGVPLTVNGKLEVGAVTETVEVSATGELVQASSATVTSTVQQRQVLDLPFISRGGMDLLVTQPGVQTGGTNRTSYINGLPQSAISVTIDGINTQDNYYKNNDGFFTLIPARQDSLEEISISTSASGVDSNSQGAAQVKFITKGGTNEYHGGSFWQHRNTALNANSYFNNINGLTRNKVILNQGGLNIGGPIWKNKIFFFTNYELYRYPAQTTITRVVATPDAALGNFTYPVGTGTTTVNVLQKAALAGFLSTTDPIITQTLSQINGYTKNGTLQDRTASNSDWNRKNLLFQPKGLTQYWTDTTRLDFHLTDKHSLQLVWTYYKNSSVPDITNSVTAIYPGTGVVLGADTIQPSQSGIRYAVSGSLRSSLTPTLTNELRFGVNRGLSMFRGEVSGPGLFSQWKGYCPTLGFSLSNVSSVCGSSRRQSPVRELHDTMSMQKGKHTLSFGFDVSQINFWAQTVGTSVIPTLSTSGLATSDPVNTGATSIFTATNFPGATSSQLTDAGALYALLTGRIVSFGRSLAYDGASYVNQPPTERNRQYEWGLFAQDSWRIAPDLTLNLGLRFEQQRPFQNRDGVYSIVTYQSLYGVSGVGNLFRPGTLTGQVPTLDKYTGSYSKIPNMWNPSVGLAWRMPAGAGPLALLFGREKGKAVLRAGYAISTVRNGSYTFQNMYGSNAGLTYDASINPSTYPTDFGAPGSVLLRNSSFPVRSGLPSKPNYPLAPTFTNALNGYDPNLKTPYVQSWNLGFQRELSKSTVMEVRYTGNHGIKAWRQINLNEVNTVENGFQKEFYIAQQNLWINRGCKTSWNDCANASTSFANAGLPGQGNFPLMFAGLNYTSDTNVSNYLRQNRVASVSSLIYNNATAMSRVTAAGYPANTFVVNPTVAGGGAYLLINGGMSTYNALQVEVNRRMTNGLLAQGSYVWSHSFVNGSQNDLADGSQPTTLRNLALDKVPGGYDIRHAIKINTVYEMPFGKGHRFLASAHPVVDKVIGGWQISGIGRMQSGVPFQLTSGRSGMNTQETGVVLNNITQQELQSMVQIRKVTASTGLGQVMWLPDSIIANSNAAFEINGKSWSNLDSKAPYIGPQLLPGSFGYKVYLYNPWQYHLDLAATKKTDITERVKAELQVSFIDALNLTNFFLANAPSSTSFGRTTTTYNDFSGSADPGSRVIEFRLRVRF